MMKFSDDQDKVAFGDPTGIGIRTHVNANSEHILHDG